MCIRDRVKELLIKLNRGVPSVNLDDVLVDLKLAPEVLEVPVPRFFIEDQAHALAEREKLLDVLLLQAGLTDKKKGKDARDDTLMTLESAIRTVQLNERGRQGRQRAKFMKDIRSQEDRDRRLMEKKEEEREPEYASVLIQQNWRGYISRKRTNEMRAEELIFIGMAPPPRKPPRVCELLRAAYGLRRGRWPAPSSSTSSRSLRTKEASRPPTRSSPRRWRTRCSSDSVFRPTSRGVDPC